MNKKIYLLLDCIEHEGFYPICSFEKKQTAEKIMQACIEYDHSRPQPGDLETDEEWDEYDLQKEEWLKKHPLNGIVEPSLYCCISGYSIIEINLI